MAKPSKGFVPKYVIRHLDDNIARLEKTQAERQKRIDALRDMRRRLMQIEKPNDDNPVE